MAEQLDLFPETLRHTPAATLDERIRTYIALYQGNSSMQNLACLKAVIDQRLALEHRTPR